MIIEGMVESTNIRVLDILSTGYMDMPFARMPLSFSIAVPMVISGLEVIIQRDTLYISDWTCQVEVIPRGYVAESEFRSR